MKNEATLYRAVAKCVKDAGGLAVKLHDVSTGGLPDMLVVVYGKTVFIETKMNRRITTNIEPLLTPLQRVVLPKLARGHAPVAVVAYHVRSKQYHAYRVLELGSPAVTADTPLQLLYEFTGAGR